MKKINLFDDGTKVHIEFEYLEQTTPGAEEFEVVSNSLEFRKVADALSFIKGFLGSDSFYENKEDEEDFKQDNQLSAFEKPGLL